MDSSKDEAELSGQFECLMDDASSEVDSDASYEFLELDASGSSRPDESDSDKHMLEEFEGIEKMWVMPDLSTICNAVSTDKKSFAHVDSINANKTTQTSASETQAVSTKTESVSKCAETQTPAIQRGAIPKWSKSTSESQKDFAIAADGPGDPKVIWKGMLEWEDEGYARNAAATLELPFQVSRGAENGEPEVNAGSWPTKLVLNFVPKRLVRKNGLENSKSVSFTASPCGALEALLKVMSQGYAGCIYLPSTPPSSNKELLLLYTAEKRSKFIGYIPNDQQAYVDRLMTGLLQRQSIRANSISRIVQKWRGAFPTASQFGISTFPTSQTNTRTMSGITQNDVPNKELPRRMQSLAIEPMQQDQIDTQAVALPSAAGGAAEGQIDAGDAMAGQQQETLEAAQALENEPQENTSDNILPPSALRIRIRVNLDGNQTFIRCEICDAYLADMAQVKNHMEWIHKVKIHPGTIRHNRPPINCRKCEMRFFSSEGLERHLLGSHGLVSSEWQRAKNTRKDGGRCPHCGRVYVWRGLLNHLVRDHGITLKPANLSYKCSVCKASFGTYKQFESHVYTVHCTFRHADRAKRATDKIKQQSQAQ